MDTGELFVAGGLAGLGVAMPLGAIGVLLFRQGTTGGFASASAGALAVAAVDTAYCIAAVVLGSTVGTWVASLGRAPGAVAGIVLVALGAHGLWRSWGTSRSKARGPRPGRPETVAGTEALRQTAAVTSKTVPRTHTGRVFLLFLGLTAVNPVTLVYFTALATALEGVGASVSATAAFVAGVAAASALWQIALAGVGAFLGGRITERAQKAVGTVSSLIVLVLGAAALLRATG
ncbi:LysE family transporter [Nocardiopsis deserti]|uniref:LysE family transporter n=1 Tax=Nocardiopsis deserti TaxID=2605988 RepID=UPI00123B44A3|nr:LysE family transporter [Nocardiopsis deserti]